MVTNDNCVKSIVEKDILMSCGVNVRNILSKISREVFESIQEIRLRISRPLMVVEPEGDYLLKGNGEITKSIHNAYVVTAEDIRQTLELMSENSLYAYQEELKNGFLTLRGGHRAGLTGKVIAQHNEIRMVKDISGLNIRIARQVKGCAQFIVPFIINDSSVSHTLILSPPNCGKTTMLRDIVRQISSGIEEIGFGGMKVGLVDERSEIAASFRGVPQNDVGIRTDVLDSCPKPQGILMLVRSMSPQVIVTDELGTKDDINAVEEALNAGVKIITTAHAKDLDELSRKPGIGILLKQGLFERIIILSNAKGPGTVENIIDGTYLTSIWRCKDVS